MKTWLVLDCNYLARRAYHAMGDLSFNNTPTGVLFGFLKDICTLQDLHNSRDVVFCFDFGKGRREQDHPTYKAARRAAQAALAPAEQASIAQFRDQVAQLRRRYLRAAGYRNILWADGYEADDIIASVCYWSIPMDDEIIIVSSDHDFYQLLSRRVSMYKPAAKKGAFITRDSFIEEYGVKPHQWVGVKALAGCVSDSVDGVNGVGEITAAKYVRGDMNTRSTTYANIGEAIRSGRIAINTKLVKLPYPGCPAFELQPDAVTAERWAAVADELGCRSLRNAPPLPGGQTRLNTLVE